MIPKGCYTYTCPSLLNDSHCPCSLAPSPATHVFGVLACCGRRLQPEVILSSFRMSSSPHNYSFLSSLWGACVYGNCHTSDTHTLKFLLWKQMNLSIHVTHAHTHIYLLILVGHGKGFSE